MHGRIYRWELPTKRALPVQTGLETGLGQGELEVLADGAVVVARESSACYEPLSYKTRYQLKADVYRLLLPYLLCKDRIRDVATGKEIASVPGLQQMSWSLGGNILVPDTEAETVAIYRLPGKHPACPRSGAFVFFCS